MTVVFDGWYFSLAQAIIVTWSAGRCAAQRILNPMIAGGNHTSIQVPPALQWKAQNGIWHIRFFEAEKCVSGRENIPDS